MIDKPNLTVVLGGGRKSSVVDLLKRAEAELPDHAELMAFNAKRKKVDYDSYIKAGFTSGQALELIK